MFFLKIKNNIRLSVILFAAVSSVFFFNAFKELSIRWFTMGGYYTQGPFVFAVFLWILAGRLKYSGRNRSGSHAAGIFIVTSALFAGLSGEYFYINSFQFFAIYLFIIGVSVYFSGIRFVYNNIALYLFLLLAIPLPAFLLDYMTFYLKLSAASISGFLLSFIYPATALYGTTLDVNGYHIEVTPACSGMENLFAMVSLLWFLALFQKRKSAAVLDYLLAVPAAMLSNILRIVIVSFLIVNGYEKYALGIFHELIGAVVFIIIFVLISLINEWPDFKSGRDRTSESAKTSSGIMNYKPAALIIIISLMAALSVIMRIEGDRMNRGGYPLLKGSIAAETPGWKSRDEKLEDYYFSMLNTDDILMREYYKKGAPSGQSVYLYFVHGRGNRTPFLHRPELCIKGEGYDLVDKDTITISTAGNKVTRMLFVRGKKGLLVYYWYRYNGKDLDSYMDLQLKMLSGLRGRMDCSMIRLSVVVDPLNIVEGETLLRGFTEQQIPLVLNAI